MGDPVRGPGPRPVLVPGGDLLPGEKAEAVVEVDAVEHARRRAAGMGAVTDLDVLDALICLPLGAAVPIADLGVVTADHLRRVPDGAVDWLLAEGTVRRLIVPVASVRLVLVRSRTWTAGLRRAAAFAPFAARVLVVPARVAVADRLWEADWFGIGVWTTDPGTDELHELVAPAPWRQRYIKPAGWRFRERAYHTWLTHTTSG